MVPHVFPQVVNGQAKPEEELLGAATKRQLKASRAVITHEIVIIIACSCEILRSKAQDKASGCQHVLTNRKISLIAG
jgi:hypothetical protein